MTKSTAVLFILFFSLVFKLEEPVSENFFVSTLNISGDHVLCKKYESCNCFFSSYALLPGFSKTTKKSRRFGNLEEEIKGQ